MKAGYLFPFEQVKKDSNIILYGAGMVGRAYMRQLEMTGYCCVVLWADKNHDDVTTFAPQRIMDTDFDYVVVAVDKGPFQQQIKSLLLEMGVAADKIIEPVIHELDCQDYSLYTLEQFMKNPDSLDSELQNYFIQGDGYIGYFGPLIAGIRKYGGDKGELKRLLTDAITRLTSPLSEITALLLLYRAGLMDSRLMERFVTLTKDTDMEVGQRYWLLVTVNRIAFLCPELLYGNIFLHRREILRNICENFRFVFSPPVKADGKSRRIALLTCAISTYGVDSISQYTFDIANTMFTLGYDVTIYMLDTLTYDSCAAFLKPEFAVNTASSSNCAFACDSTNDGIGVIFARGETTRDRLQHILDELFAYKPCAVLDMCNDFSVLSFIYSKYFPAICIPTGPFSSSGAFHKMPVQSIRQWAAENEVYHSMTENQVLEAPFFPKPIAPKSDFSRTAHGFSEADCIMITVGNRLRYDLTPDFVDAMGALLRSRADCRWLLVGAQPGEYVTVTCADLIADRRVILWGYENDLPGLYGICDLYVNPDRIGGGFSIAWAMQHGIAMATTANAMAGLAYAGYDYAVDGGLDDLIGHITKLLDDREYLKAEGEKMRARAMKFSFENYVKKLTETAEELCQNWNSQA